MSSQMISATEMSDEDEEGALPDEVDDKGDDEDNASSLNFRGSASSSSSASSDSSRSIPTPSNLANRRLEQQQQQQQQQSEGMGEAPSTAGLFGSPHSQGGSEGDGVEGENWQVIGRSGGGKLRVRTSSVRSSSAHKHNNKSRNSHNHISTDDPSSSAFSRQKLSRTMATTASAVPDTNLSGEYEEATAGPGGLHSNQRNWKMNGQQHQFTALQQVTSAEVSKGPAVPSTDFSLLASASSVTQLSTDGSIAVNDDLVDSYNAFVNTLLSFPSQADNYYRLAMKNAFDTLSDYSKNLGVDGSEFLKHLYAYFILGIKVYHDLRGLQSILTSTITQPGLIIGGPLSNISAHHGNVIPPRLSPNLSPFGSAMVSPTTVHRAAAAEHLIPQQVTVGSVNNNVSFRQQQQQQQSQNRSYSQIDQSNCGSQIYPQLNMASRMIHYPPPPSQPPPESTLNASIVAGGMDPFQHQQQHQQQQQQRSFMMHQRSTSNSGGAGRGGGSGSGSRWNRQPGYPTAETGDTVAVAHLARRNSHAKRRRVNNVTANVTTSPMNSQPMFSTEVVSNIIAWDEQQVLSIGASGENNNKPILEDGGPLQQQQHRGPAAFTAETISKGSKPVKMEDRECLSDITLESEGDDDDIESARVTGVTGMCQSPVPTGRGCPPPPPPPPPPALDANEARNLIMVVAEGEGSLPDLESCEEFDTSISGGAPQAPFDYSNNSTTCGSKTTAGVTPTVANEDRHYGVKYSLCRSALARLSSANEEEIQIDMCPSAATLPPLEATSCCSSAPPPPPPPPPPYLTPPQSGGSSEDSYLGLLPHQQQTHLHDDYLRHPHHHVYHNRSTPTATVKTGSASSTTANLL